MTLGLLIYQISGFAMIGWLVATRDRSTLSMAENQSAGRLGWVLIVLVPLIAADFLLIALRLPVQLSAIGVLILCWVALDLVHAVPRHRQSFARAGGKIAVAAVTGLVIGLIGQMGREGVILAMALTVAMVLVIAIVEQRYDARRHAPQLIAHIATAPMDTPVGFLRDLRAHPWVKDAAIIDVAALAGFQPQVLADIFAQYPVLRRSDHAPDDPVMTDHIAHLFARFEQWAKPQCAWHRPQGRRFRLCAASWSPIMKTRHRWQGPRFLRRGIPCPTIMARARPKL